jgi:hypothetical protein
MRKHRVSRAAKALEMMGIRKGLHHGTNPGAHEMWGKKPINEILGPLRRTIQKH